MKCMFFSLQKIHPSSHYPPGMASDNQDGEWIPANKRTGAKSTKFPRPTMAALNDDERKILAQRCTTIEENVEAGKLSLWHIAPFDANKMTHGTYAQDCLRRVEGVFFRALLPAPSVGAGVAVFAIDKTPDYALFPSTSIFRTSLSFANGPTLAGIVQSDILAFWWSGMVETFVSMMHQDGHRLLHGARLTLHVDGKETARLKKQHRRGEIYKVDLEVWYESEDNLIGAPARVLQALSQIQLTLAEYRLNAAQASVDRVSGKPAVFIRQLVVNSEGEWLESSK